MNKLKLLKTNFRMRLVSCRSLSTPAPPPSPSSSAKPTSMNARYRPSNFEKKILVWTKKFKSQDEVPQFVSADLLEKSRSQARIKLANILMLLTALGSVVAIIMGKAAAKRGESVHQMNLDFHKKYNEEYNKKHGIVPENKD